QVRAARDFGCGAAWLELGSAAPRAREAQPLVAAQRDPDVLAAHARDRSGADRGVRLGHAALPAHSSRLRVVRTHPGELRRTLRIAAAQVAERTLRTDAAAPFLEHEPHLLEPDLVPPAA